MSAKPVYLALILCFIFDLSLPGQVKYDYTWKLGSAQDIPEPPFLYDGVILNFNDNSLTITEDTILYGTSFIGNSISDIHTGELMFYTNHCFIADTNNQFIENGGHLFIDGDYRIFCKSYYPEYQDNLFLPIDKDNFYFIQKFTRIDFDFEYGTVTDFLISSKIVKENDNWKVKNPLNPISRDTMAGGQLQAVKKANASGWWLVITYIDYRRFKIYSVDSSGITLHREQMIGDTTIRYSGSTTGVIFSPDGRWYARYDGLNGLNMYEFDREDGRLHDHFRIHPKRNEEVGIGGAGGDVAFSPNSRYVYVSTFDTLFQYDLQADDFEESGIVVSSFDPEVDTGGLWSNFNRMMIAPDCRIYINRFFGDTRDLHVINQPNQRSTACEVIKQAYKLPVPISNTEVNYPNYRLGTPWEDRCDSILSSASPPAHVDEELRQLKILPNPASHTAKVVLQKEIPGEILLQVFDMQGQVKYNSTLDWHRWTRHELPIHRWSPGLYVVRLQTESGEVYSGKLILNF